TDAARWHHLPLPAGAVRSARELRRAYAWAAETEDVYLIAIEDPYSPRYGTAKRLATVAGAILASIPDAFADELIWLLRPDEWRLACGLPGNASKEHARLFCESKRLAAAQRRAGGPVSAGAVQVGDWPQDACDAFCLAWAAREMNRRGLEAA
ncbi:MAG: hypothetical protein RMM28_11415, partial [Thermoleophilia bacterium]|nr:hypothetical protein [Thermoleophilia bacterium]